jgi:hypothetical protein
MQQTRQVIETYGLDYELVDGSTAAMTASVKSAMAKKQWIATIMWTPLLDDAGLRHQIPERPQKRTAARRSPTIGWDARASPTITPKPVKSWPAFSSPWMKTSR